MIKIHYESIDGCLETRKYKTLRGARKFAHDMVGPHPSGRYSGYAVSDDGVGKVTIDGASFDEIFPRPVTPFEYLPPCEECDHPILNCHMVCPDYAGALKLVRAGDEMMDDAILSIEADTSIPPWEAKKDHVRIYQDLGSLGEVSYMVYRNGKPEGPYLVDDPMVKMIMKAGIKVRDGIDNRRVNYGRSNL